MSKVSVFHLSLELLCELSTHIEELRCVHQVGALLGIGLKVIEKTLAIDDQLCREPCPEVCRQTRRAWDENRQSSQQRLREGDVSGVKTFSDRLSLLKVAPATGLEPVTKWLTATYSTIELRRNVFFARKRVER
jgi:hypothetical protein